MDKNLGIVGSSVDQSEVAATVSGLILTFSATFMAIAQHYGLPLTQNGVATYAEQMGLAAGSLWFLFGFFRKVVVKTSIWWKNRSQTIQIG